MSFMTSNTDHLIRSQLWSSDIKEVLLDEIMGMGHVRMLTEFTDGDLINIPSIGQFEVQDYAEGQAVRYTSADTGNFTFTIDQYKHSGTYITEKMKQDSYLTSELMARFVPGQLRAIMAEIETKIMALGPEAQTASDLNTINGGDHRFVASGSSQVFALKDFARAKYALDKANVPQTGRIAIVDPATDYQLSTLTNLVALDSNPMWEGIITEGLSTGLRFTRRIFGFDVYVSNYLKSGITETINSVSVTNGVANLFFSADASVTPYVGLMRQPPKVDSEYNKDLQREEYVTTCRYGFGLIRPENMVVVLSAPTVA